MYKVVLIDDEYWALKGLYDSYNWAANGFEVVRRFTDPAEALEYLQLEPPDLVFTDVRMDGLSGLELISNLRSECRIREFVVVSGYARFDFVQSSLRLGVFDYLLKPIDRGELAGLMSRIGERLSKETAPGQPTTEINETVAHDSLNMILAYMRSHYAETLTLNALAQEFFLSDTYICDLFKKHLGKTFTVYLQEIRLKHAKSLLSETSRPVSEIARDVGYPDGGYFSRIFRRYTHMSPVQYRHRFQPGNDTSTEV